MLLKNPCSRVRSLLAASVFSLATTVAWGADVPASECVKMGQQKLGWTTVSTEVLKACEGVIAHDNAPATFACIQEAAGPYRWNNAHPFWLGLCDRITRAGTKGRMWACMNGTNKSWQWDTSSLASAGACEVITSFPESETQGIYECLFEGSQKLNWEKSYPGWVTTCQSSLKDGTKDRLFSCVQDAKSIAGWVSSDVKSVDRCKELVAQVEKPKEVFSCLADGYNKIGWKNTGSQTRLDACTKAVKGGTKDGLFSCMLKATAVGWNGDAAGTLEKCQQYVADGTDSQKVFSCLDEGRKKFNWNAKDYQPWLKTCENAAREGTKDAIFSCVEEAHKTLSWEVADPNAVSSCEQIVKLGNPTDMLYCLRANFGTTEGKTSTSANFCHDNLAKVAAAREAAIQVALVRDQEALKVENLRKEEALNVEAAKNAEALAARKIEDNLNRAIAQLDGDPATTGQACLAPADLLKGAEAGKLDRIFEGASAALECVRNLVRPEDHGALRAESSVNWILEIFDNLSVSKEQGVKNLSNISAECAKEQVLINSDKKSPMNVPAENVQKMAAARAKLKDIAKDRPEVLRVISEMLQPASKCSIVSASVFGGLFRGLSGRFEVRLCHEADGGTSTYLGLGGGTGDALTVGASLAKGHVDFQPRSNGVWQSWSEVLRQADVVVGRHNFYQDDPSPLATSFNWSESYPTPKAGTEWSLGAAVGGAEFRDGLGGVRISVGRDKNAFTRHVLTEVCRNHSSAQVSPQVSERQEAGAPVTVASDGEKTAPKALEGK